MGRWDQPGRPTGSSSAEGLSADARDVKVLLADDDQNIRYLLRLIFEDDPELTVVDEVASALAAVELARELQPDLVVLDHSMEGEMDGLEAAPLIKREAPKAKIVFFSSSKGSEHAGSEPAIDLVLTKDRLHDLLPMVRRLLGLRRTEGGGDRWR